MPRITSVEGEVNQLFKEGNMPIKTTSNQAVDESVKDVDTMMGENEYFKLFRGILPG